MKSIVNYIDDCKVKTGSDNATAIAIGVERTVIAKIRSRNAIADENAVKVAELLGIDPAEVLLAAALARSAGPVRDAWMAISKRAGIAASIIVVAFVTLGFPRESYAAQSGENIHYANSRGATRRRRGFCSWLDFVFKESIKWLRNPAFTIPVGIAYY